MCGFTGFWQFNKQAFSKPYDKVALEMAAAIHSRGPDDEGAWSDEKAGLAFGHRRLSILDLSQAGHQPMQSHSGRLTIAYNGEVYNAFEIRQDLEALGKSFKSHSDTEVILEAIETWGISKALPKFVGMFAFSLWDKESKKLYLVRDRLGIKPLYWGNLKGTLFFGSQLKSFKAHPKWEAETDRDALVSYFRYNYVPAPLSIYKGIQKQRPGTWLEIDANGQVREEYYWDFKKISKEKSTDRVSLSDKEAVDQLEGILKDAIEKRMIADVPLGAFLSGGVDSSTVVALMQSMSTKPVKTFSIGFDEDEYNEATHAREVAKHLNTEHHELYLKPKEAQEVIPQLPGWYDEPFADSSQIPTYLVSRMTRDHVTVALSGDGGDELFAGYNRYFLGQSIWSKIAPLPGFMKAIGKVGIEALSPSAWDVLGKVIPSSLRPQHFGDKLHKLASILPHDTVPDFYKTLVSQWEDPASLVQGGEETDLWAREGLSGISFETYPETMQFMDTMTYLPDDILTKVDRASMAVSLEARVPLLDHRVVEFAWSLPESLKIRKGVSKWVLREVLYRHVPKSLIERPKMGFGVPIGDWIRGPLNEWAESLLDAKSLEDGGLNPDPILKRWKEHQSSTRNWQYSLWSILMYQAWRSGE